MATSCSAASLEKMRAHRGIKRSAFMIIASRFVRERKKKVYFSPREERREGRKGAMETWARIWMADAGIVRFGCAIFRLKRERQRKARFVLLLIRRQGAVLPLGRIRGEG